MPRALISPFVNEENDYIAMQRSALAEAGFDVEPFSFRMLASSRLLGIFDSRNIIVVHWLETRLFQTHAGRPRVSLSGMIQFVVYMLVMMVARARVVYFVHDHAVHDLFGWRKKLSARSISCLRWVADIRFVHDPSFSDSYNAVYVPHPLYWQFHAVGHTSSALPDRANPEDASVFGVLGAIRPYKGIDRLLGVWPCGQKLLIAGKSNPDYVSRLQKIVVDRSLDQDVELRVGFLSKESFGALLDAIDVLILPHQPDSMLVSGAFFEAIGRVPCVMARSSPFIEWVAARYAGVLSFREDAEVPRVVAECLKRLPSLNPGVARDFAADEFGWAKVVNTYRANLLA